MANIVPEGIDQTTGNWRQLTSSDVLTDKDGNPILGGTGIQGLTGIQGITGLQGETGIQGDTGTQGDTGFGVAGETGLMGPGGAQGDPSLCRTWLYPPTKSALKLQRKAFGRISIPTAFLDLDS